MWTLIGERGSSFDFLFCFVLFCFVCLFACLFLLLLLTQFSFTFSSRWHHRLQKCPYAFCPVSQKFPQCWPGNSTSVDLIELRSFLTSEGKVSTVSFVRSSLRQATNTEMLSGLPLHRKFLKPLSTSTLMSCRPTVTSALLASLPECFHSLWRRQGPGNRCTI